MRIQNVNSECSDSDASSSGSNTYTPYQGEDDFSEGQMAVGVENVASGSVSSLDDGQMLIDVSAAGSEKVNDCSQHLTAGVTMEELLKGSVVLTFMLKNLR